MPVQIHLSETEEEVTRCVAEHGVRPAEYLDRVGLLGPRTVLAHGVWLDDARAGADRRRAAPPSSPTRSPTSSSRSARVFPYPAARRHGVARRPRHRRAGLEQLAGPASRT